MLANQQLLQAVRKGQKSEVRHLLNQGANPNFVYTSTNDNTGNDDGDDDDDSMEGWTPLHFAASQGSFGNACLLLEKGAKVMAKDKLGRTPLHLASKKNHIKVAWLLVDNGADLSEADPGTYFMHLFCLDKTLEQQKADMAAFVQKQQVAHQELQTTLQQEQEQQKVYMKNLEERHAKYRLEQESLNRQHEDKLATLQDKLERLLNPEYNEKQQALEETAAREKDEQMNALRAENEALKQVIARLEKQQEQDRQKAKMQALQETMARFQAEMASLQQQGETTTAND